MLKITGLTLAAGLLAVSAFAANVQSGLKPGAELPAFDVADVTGPSKGKQLCYRCQYGGNPVMAAFIKSSPSAQAAFFWTAVSESLSKFFSASAARVSPLSPSAHADVARTFAFGSLNSEMSGSTERLSPLRPKAHAAFSRTSVFWSLNASIRGSTLLESPINPNPHAACSRTG